MYSLPKVIVTNYRKLGGLNQQKFVFLQFWKPEEVKVLAGENRFLSPSAPGSHGLPTASVQPLPPSAPVLFPVSLCVSSSVSQKDASHGITGFQAHPNPG